MQIISLDEPHIINKRPRRNVIKTFRLNVFALIIVLVSAVALTVAVVVGVAAGKYMRVSAEKYYLVEFGAYDTLLEARSAAEKNAASGGAGYVLNDGKFRVIGAAYRSKADAEAVKAKQSDAASVYILKIAAVKRPLIADGKTSKAAAAYMNKYKKYLSDLYAVTLALDAGEQGESVLAASIAEASAVLTLAATQKQSTLSSRIKYALVDILNKRAELSVLLGEMK